MLSILYRCNTNKSGCISKQSMAWMFANAPLKPVNPHFRFYRYVGSVLFHRHLRLPCLPFSIVSSTHPSSASQLIYLLVDDVAGLERRQDTSQRGHTVRDAHQCAGEIRRQVHVVDVVACRNDRVLHDRP